VNENTEQENKEEVVIAEDKATVDLNDLNLDQLIAKIEELSANINPYAVSKEIENIKSVFYQKLRADLKTEDIEEKEINETEQSPAEKEKILHPLEIKFKGVFGNYRKIKSNFRKVRDDQEQKNLKIKQQIIEDIDKLTQEEESLKKTFEQFRNLQEKWKNTGYVPASMNNNLWQSYHHHVELFYDFIKLNNDLRDLDFTRNLEEKTAICVKAEDLVNERLLNKMHDSLQELHEHWKSVGPVKRELREGIWERFQKISRILNKKRNDYFIAKKEEDKQKLTKKNDVCSRIDALTKDIPDSHNKWQILSNKCNELEDEWKNLGRLNKVENKIAWTGFRASLNNFYQKKNTFYKEKKSESSKVLEIKITICEKAEALQSDTNWQETANKLIKLQEEWKTAGYSSNEQSNKIWKRFKDACDTFFKARKTHFKVLDKEKEENFKVKKELIEELQSKNTAEDKKAVITSLKEFASRWKTLGHVPRNKMKINEDFFSLINTKFEEIGLSKDDLEKEKFKNKANSLKGNEKAINGEKQILKNKIDTIKKDIAQYENNMSFLAKNKGTQPLVKQVLHQIGKSNNEIEAIKNKLQILNKG
jgi:hypothetical protein